MKSRKFNQNWLFHNDIHNTGEITVNLPHDAMQTEKRLPGMKNGAAAGFYPGGRYVYNKKLFGKEEYRGKTVLLEFEGIYMKSSVYLNGEKIGGWIYGYTGFYVDLLTGIERANDAKAAEGISKDLPMLIISGDKDPVGAYGKGVRKVFRLYRKAGLGNVRLRLFPDDRHEILNETDSDAVMDEIGRFCLSVMGHGNE